MKYGIIFFLFLIPTFLFGQEEALQFEQANQLYRSGKYQEATQMFEKIVMNGYESAALYYNLGNAHFKLQNIPSAILAYERAKRIAPQDEDVLYNLRLANLRVIDKIEPLPRLFIIDWWNSIIDLFPSSMWAAIGIGGLWVAICFGALFMSARSALVQKFSFIIIGTTLIVTIVACIGMLQRAEAEHSTEYAIVFSQSIAVKSAPDSQSTELFALHEGVKVEVLDAVGEWRKIRLADGKVGWLTAASMWLI